MYSVNVYQEDIGELIVVDVAVEDSGDPTTVRLVVYALKPGT